MPVRIQSIATKQIVKTCANLKSARRVAEKMNMEYGCHNFTLVHEDYIAAVKAQYAA